MFSKNEALFYYYRMVNNNFSLTKDHVGICIPNLNTNSQTGIYDNQ